MNFMLQLNRALGIRGGNTIIVHMDHLRLVQLLGLVRKVHAMPEAGIADDLGER